MPGAKTLCLNSRRFKVTVEWKTASGGGAGIAEAITGDTGYFWFFDPANIELVVKVLDGTALNDHFWVFYGALSDVEYTITVEDTTTRKKRTYHNPRGQLASVGDTQALPKN